MNNDPTRLATAYNYFYWKDSARIEYTTVSGGGGIVKIDNSREFHSFFSERSNSGDPIKTMILTAHGSEQGTIVLGPDPSDPYNHATILQSNKANAN